jgi:predicted metal-dependent phosphoesterase TrpH
MSDGTDSPTRVVQLAGEAGLSALALTDHDTLDHLTEARAAADAQGVRLVAGSR